MLLVQWAQVRSLIGKLGSTCRSVWPLGGGCGGRGTVGDEAGVTGLATDLGVDTLLWVEAGVPFGQGSPQGCLNGAAGLSLPKTQMARRAEGDVAPPRLPGPPAGL